ncbi:MAG TPA: helix-hairpin-helix domain-containing protein [Gemmatimonadales bacterium]|jgi:competence protein ComEA|nr:helix-hairpin-helix domain-containing protein [Gemmatimonadales bacterium]
MSSTERRALVLLLALALVGQGVRWLMSRPGQAPGEVQLLSVLPPRSPAAHRDSILALARPLGPDERIDADRATAAELARLPRVGLGLAKTIVADREAHGPFGSAQGLDRVRGVGPGLLQAIGPHLGFSGTPAAAPVGAEPGQAQMVDLNAGGPAELEGLPGVGPARAAAIVRYREIHGRFGSVEELGGVPGIGPAALARLQGRVKVQ